MAIGGIYRIKNKVNGKFYIGSTKDFYHRKHSHFSKLNLGKHVNLHLQSAWAMYGSEAFCFEPLESYESPTNEELEIWEQWYLDNCICDYNISKTSSCAIRGYWTGRKRTEENINKLKQLRGERWSRFKKKDSEEVRKKKCGRVPHNKGTAMPPEERKRRRRISAGIYYHNNKQKCADAQRRYLARKRAGLV